MRLRSSDDITGKRRKIPRDDDDLQTRTNKLRVMAISPKDEETGGIQHGLGRDKVIEENLTGPQGGVEDCEKRFDQRCFWEAGGV